MAVAKRSALAVQREIAGHTQESLAGAIHVDRTTVLRWERGKGEPRPWQRMRLAQELNVSPGQLEELIRETLQSVSVLEQRRPGRVVDSSPQTAGGGRSSPQPLAQGLLQDSDESIADWAATRTTPASSRVDGHLWASAEQIAVADGMLRMFRQLDHTHGARPYAAHVAEYIDGELATLLGRPVADAEALRDRALVATGFLELAGYQAVDTGNPAAAQSYYRRALVFTSATDNRSYGAYLVAVNLGHLALHCGHPDTALRWAESAHATAGTAASPATRAAITAVRARARARMGQEREASALMVQAEALLDSASPEDEPEWIKYFTPAYLADEAAHCLHDLGHAPAARHQLADALHGVGRDKVRRLAIDATLLASTWLRSGDIDQACSVGRDAVDYAARTSSGRCVQGVTDLLVALHSRAGHALVGELQDYAQHRLPEAHAAAIGLLNGS